MARTFKEQLQAAMMRYELNREKLKEYTEELEITLKSAQNNFSGKICKCVADLVVAQAEYCDSLKAEVAKWYALALLPEIDKKISDHTAEYAMTAEEAVAAREQAAIRASHSADLIEQAKLASTERETLDAMANFDANLHTKSHAIIHEWHEAFDIFKYARIRAICERNFLTGEEFTIGEYLELSAENKKRRDDTGAISA